MESTAWKENNLFLQEAFLGSQRLCFHSLEMTSGQQSMERTVVAKAFKSQG